MLGRFKMEALSYDMTTNGALEGKKKHLHKIFIHLEKAYDKVKYFGGLWKRRTSHLRHAPLGIVKFCVQDIQEKIQINIRTCKIKYSPRYVWENTNQHENSTNHNWFTSRFFIARLKVCSGTWWVNKTYFVRSFMIQVVHWWHCVSSQN